MKNRKRAYRRACERKQKKRMKELYDIFCQAIEDASGHLFIRVENKNQPEGE